MKTFTIEANGSLTVFEATAAATATTPATGRSWSIDRAQIALHRRDPAFEAELQASTDLTPAQKAALPVPPAPKA